MYRDTFVQPGQEAQTTAHLSFIDSNYRLLFTIGAASIVKMLLKPKLAPGQSAKSLNDAHLLIQLSDQDKAELTRALEESLDGWMGTAKIWGMQERKNKPLSILITACQSFVPGVTEIDFHNSDDGAPLHRFTIYEAMLPALITFLRQ